LRRDDALAGKENWIFLGNGTWYFRCYRGTRRVTEIDEFRTIMKMEAFTRVELLTTLAVLGLLAIVTASVCADTRDRSERIMCLNNQRLIGRGFHAWSADHGAENPWWVFARQGGTRPEPGGPVTLTVPGVANYPAVIANNAWFQFMWVYEELPSPSVLVCPADPGRQRASNFSAAPGGFAHPSMGNNALSYLIGLHAVREQPSELLSADRNMTTTAGSGGCSSGVTGFRTIAARGGPPAAWTNGLHGVSGNLLMNDGRVQQMTTQDLNAWVNSFNSDAGAFHVLLP
jgi:hypothetical protein